MPARTSKTVHGYRRAQAVFAASLLSLAVIAGAQQQPSGGSGGGAVRAADYGALPLSFEANRGQAGDGVRFLAHGDGYALYLPDSDAILSLHGAAKCNPPTLAPVKDASAAVPCGSRRDQVRMKLAGASIMHDSAMTGPRAAGEEELPGKVNYFVGKDPAKWRSDLPTYSKVRYSAVYPGIDLVYYGNQRQLEYDFLVAPGASPAAIRLSFSGQKRLRIDRNGDLAVEAADGSLTFHKPVLYQTADDGKRQPVAGAFKLVAKNTIGFTPGAHDPARPLVIDPVLVYSTYLGGSGTIDLRPSKQGDLAKAIAVDSSGCAYVVGTAWSLDFPLTGGSYQHTNKPATAKIGGTVFVTKMNATGTALFYSTFLGGSGAGDFGIAIAVDSANNAYLTGTTYSHDFPVTSGAFQVVNKSAPIDSSTAFVTKLNAAGSKLLYSTYLGGTSPFPSNPADGVQAIAVDSKGIGYVTGYTQSPDFPVTAGAFQTVMSVVPLGFGSGFVTAVNADATGLIYSTFLGGSKRSEVNGNSWVPYADSGNGIAVDSLGDAYVTGTTYSSDFPVTSGAFQTVNHGTANGSSNGFVTKLNPAGTALVYSSYLGGSGIGSPNGVAPSLGERASAIALDSEGNAYITGRTHSKNFPVTAGVLNSVRDGNGSGFVAKFNATGAELTYSTLLGGDYSQGTGIAADGAGVAYVTGTSSSEFVQTPDTLPSNSSNVFVAKLNPTAMAWEYASAIGGTRGYQTPSDQSGGLALDSAGNVYLVESTWSLDFPTTPGAFQSTNNGSAELASNAFISKIALASETFNYFNSQTSVSASPITLNQGQL